LKNHLTQAEKGAWETPEGEFKEVAVISDTQAGQIAREFNQTRDIDLLSAPSVTTKDEHEAKIEVVIEFRYATDFQVDKNPITAKDSEAKTVVLEPPVYTPTAFATKNLGVTLDVKPKVKQDGGIELNVAPATAGFIGFLSEKDGVKSLDWEFLSATGGRGPNQPVFSTSTGKVTDTISAGQTILLGAVRLDCKKDNGLKELAATTEGPGATLRHMFPKSAEPPETARTVLLVFVTAKIVKLPTPVEGKVVAVNSGWHFVVINIGKNQGAVEGEEGNVFRENQGITAKLKITTVEPDTSVADFTIPDDAGWTLHPGDIVTLTQPAAGGELVGESASPSAQPSPTAVNKGPDLPYGVPIDGKPGYVTSPYAPNDGAIDVRGYDKGTEVKDPYSGKIFLVP